MPRHHRNWAVSCAMERSNSSAALLIARLAPMPVARVRSLLSRFLGSGHLREAVLAVVRMISRAQSLAEMPAISDGADLAAGDRNADISFRNIRIVSERKRGTPQGPMQALER